MPIRLMVILLLFCALLFLLSPQPAMALDAGAESVENYSGCGCNTGNLHYCNDQASKFINKIDNWHTRKFWYKDGNAWNSDLIEDELGGTDYPYGDEVHILLISGHGGLRENTYSGYLCKSGNYNSCSYDTSKVYLGETPEQDNSTHPGKLRFLILCTCHSVDKDKAVDVWYPVFWRGKNLLYVMGYHGTSADCETTDEVPEDFAKKAAGKNWKLKKAWFWAAEDWWVDDTAALISRGSTRDEAINNRDNMKLDWSPPACSSWSPTWFAWAWHEG
jgi:hypothetical protein